jgi:hypothetical protein
MILVKFVAYGNELFCVYCFLRVFLKKFYFFSVWLLPSKKKLLYLQSHSTRTEQAKVAQLVERNLAKVKVAGSRPVFRSRKKSTYWCYFFWSAEVVELVDTQDLKSCEP